MTSTHWEAIQGFYLEVGNLVGHGCVSPVVGRLSRKVGDGRRDKSEFHEILRRLNEPTLLTYIAFGGNSKRWLLAELDRL